MGPRVVDSLARIRSSLQYVAVNQNFPCVEKLKAKPEQRGLAPQIICCWSAFTPQLIELDFLTELGHSLLISVI